jgi:hypothetical protein
LQFDVMNWAIRKNKREAPRAGLLAVAVVALSALLPRFAAADARQPVAPLLVMRSDAPTVDQRVAREVDLVLAETLARSGHFAARFSPAPYADVKLAAGCGERDTECLKRIANTLGSEWLLVRELFRDRQGVAHLTLMAQDGRDGTVSRRASAPLSRDGGATPAQVVPLLVSRLYNLALAPEPVGAPASAPPATRRLDDARERRVDMRAAFGWPSVIGGSALVATGAVFAVLSKRDENAYADQEIRVPADVDRAEDLLDRSRREAKVANGLLIGGAGLLAVGTGLLLWRHFSPRSEGGSALRWGATPVAGGAALLVAGETSRRR